jgi:hypothetical protein
MKLGVEMRKLFVFFFVLATSMAANAQKVSPDVSVQIQPISGGGSFCLDAARDVTHDGDKVQIWQCHGSANQRWTITTSTDDKERAIIGIGGYCLDVRADSTQAGAPAQLWKCHFQQNQRFTVEPDGHIFERVSGRCLVATAPQNGASVVLNSCQNTPGQRWVTAH